MQVASHIQKSEETTRGDQLKRHRTTPDNHRQATTLDNTMTTHVEKAIPEPAMEPVPASPSKQQSFNEEMLSPVSKLELARKYAAEEQEKRVSQACERMVVVKKAQLVKKLEIEARLESHIEAHAHDDAPKRSGRLSDIAMRLVGAFKSTNDENNATAANEKDDDDETASPTGKLLRATRNKLNEIAVEQGVEEGADLPATNYHLKQLGLVDEKINIYAPLHEQQQEIRRRRESAIRCQEKYMQENLEYPADEGYQSAEDSDYAPEEEDDEDEDYSDSDNGGVSEDELDEEEVRRLLEDQNEFTQSVATIKKHKKQSAKKAEKAKRVLSPGSIVVAIIVLVLALFVSIFVAEHQSGYCRAVVTEEPRADDVRVAACNAVVQLQDAVLHVASALPFQG